jgi:hypothetical protein
VIDSEMMSIGEEALFLLHNRGEEFLVEFITDLRRLWSLPSNESIIFS